MHVVPKKPSKESQIAADAPLVKVYNRTPTRIGGIYKFRHPKTGVWTVLTPGGDAMVPQVIAETWNKVSGGLVTFSAPDGAQASAAEALAERDRRIAELEARLAALETKTKVA